MKTKKRYFKFCNASFKKLTRDEKQTDRPILNDNDE